jgi:hypothetical protein
MKNQDDSSKIACNALIQTTTNALDSQKLKALLSTVWDQNLDHRVYWLIKT